MVVTPAGPEGEGISPRLVAALEGIAPGALPDIAEAIALRREFTEWAVWLPHGGRPWIAVRPASTLAVTAEADAEVRPDDGHAHPDPTANPDTTTNPP